ncbi:MAG: tRNA 2-thiouridine(34) synthase MnmA [Kiritimatiellae bacterium]|nr:tRNA 2-thiouridine(34) synthase MnmA [Kiritimatiellia bacterium]MDD5522420.1 tRNA 2-thiouridine(34) synthase MnmA [Kiritimatiellia bacterium]
MTAKKRIAVGLSGGIDSSVAAYLLLQQGFDVIGVTMQIWDGSLPLKDIGMSACYGPGEGHDIAAAKEHAERLGIPHHVIPLSSEFKKEILDYFRQEYLAGRTPNPCVRCNATLKFGLMLERALKAGIMFDRFATGHYARTRKDKTTHRILLLKGVDQDKDQSYFLSRLSQDQLQKVIFPLGEMTKGEVRELAEECGWKHLVEKPESQNFIEAKDYSVLFKETPANPGPILDMQGNKLGEHRGIIHYTVGQRKGVGIAGKENPMYVVRIDTCRNAVIVGPKKELMKTELKAVNLNWISLNGPSEKPLKVKARIRQQHKEAPAEIRPDLSSQEPAVMVRFEEPQMAITPGQIVVFYDGDTVLGSGVIELPA